MLDLLDRALFGFRHEEFHGEQQENELVLCSCMTGTTLFTPALAIQMDKVENAMALSRTRLGKISETN